MKMIKHFVNVAVAVSQRIFCKHLNTDVASCPFTNKTYTTCLKCYKRIDERITE